MSAEGRSRDGERRSGQVEEEHLAVGLGAEVEIGRPLDGDGIAGFEHGVAHGNEPGRDVKVAVAPRRQRQANLPAGAEFGDDV